MQYICNTYEILTNLYNNTIVDVKGGIFMFQIKPDRIDTEIKTIRFPVHLINQIEEAIVCKNVSFSGFVIQACQYALEHMESPSSDDVINPK